MTKKRREQVLRLAAEGYTNKEIADELCYSVATVKNDLLAIRDRLQARNRVNLVYKAMQEGVLT